MCLKFVIAEKYFKLKFNKMLILIFLKVKNFNSIFLHIIIIFKIKRSLIF